MPVAGCRERWRQLTRLHRSGAVYSASAKIAAQPVDCLLEHGGLLTECEPGIMPRRIRRVVEGGDWNSGYACALRDAAAEGDIVAVLFKGIEIGGDEIGSVRRQQG